MDTSSLSLEGLNIEPEQVANAISSMTLDTLFNAGLVLVGGILVIWIVMKLLRRAAKRLPLDTALVGFVFACIRVILIFVLFTMVADKLGLPTTSFVALLSLFALAISLSIQNVLGNVISGIVILSAKPFSAGNYIETSTSAGIVESINLMYTHLATPDGKDVLIPNSTIVAERITNHSARPNRRIDINIRVGYEHDNERVKEALMRTMAQVEGVLHEDGIGPEALVSDYADGGAVFIMRCWCKNADYWPVRNTLQDKVRAELRKSGIELDYAASRAKLEKE